MDRGHVGLGVVVVSVLALIYIASFTYAKRQNERFDAATNHSHHSQTASEIVFAAPDPILYEQFASLGGCPAPAEVTQEPARAETATSPPRSDPRKKQHKKTAKNIDK